MPTKAKPSALKKLHGSDQPRDEPAAHGDLVVDNAAPRDLSPLQREIWEYTLAHAPRAVLKKIDAIVLRAWVVCASLHQMATEKVNALGDDVMIELSHGQIVQSPYVGMLNRQSIIMRGLASEFGFTPVARARLGAISHAPAAEGLVRPEYGKDGPRESIEEYLDRAPGAATQH